MFGRLCLVATTSMKWQIYKCILPKLGYAGISDFQISDTHWKGGQRQRVHPYFCSNVDNGGVVEKITVLFLSYNASQIKINKYKTSCQI